MATSWSPAGRGQQSSGQARAASATMAALAGCWSLATSQTGLRRATRGASALTLPMTCAATS
eukprot:10663573-Lingulodinium_polyedra.AAC.1